MPKYKVGDVAALFPNPSKPKTESGKKMQSLFEEFYNRPNSSKKWESRKQVGSKVLKQENTFENTEAGSQSGLKKNPKRKFQNSNESNLTAEGSGQPKKPKLEMTNEVAAFPRRSNIKKRNKNSESESYLLREDMQNFTPKASETVLDEMKRDSKSQTQRNSFSDTGFNREAGIPKRKKNKCMLQNSEMLQGTKLLLNDNLNNDSVERNRSKKAKKKFQRQQSEKLQKNNATLHKVQMTPKHVFFNDTELPEMNDNLSNLNNGSTERKRPKKAKKFKKQQSEQSQETDGIQHRTQMNPNHVLFNSGKFLTTDVKDDETPQKLKTVSGKVKKFKGIHKPESSKIKFQFKSESQEISSEDSESEDFVSSENGKNRKNPNRSNQQQKIKKDITKLAGEETEERLSRTLFVGNLPISITRKGLEKLFHSFGSLESCRLRGAVPVKSTIPKKVADIKRKYHAGLHSRIGYVVLKNRKDAIEAMSLSGMLMDGHHIVVDRATAAKEKKMYDGNRSIFVGNLPFDVEDEVVWSAFSQCGDIETVRVIRDRETGAGKGFGYVSFQKINSKENALGLTNLEIDGRKLRIKSVESEKKKLKSPTQWNAIKRIARKEKSKQDNSNSRKSLKKIMKREKLQHQKKKIANIFKNLSKK